MIELSEIRRAYTEGEIDSRDVVVLAGRVGVDPTTVKRHLKGIHNPPMLAHRTYSVFLTKKRESRG